MLVIRLFRVGKKNQPSYKIVVIDKSKASRRGRFVEEVGFYNPLTKEKILKGERIKYWMSQGVKPSDTVHNLLVSQKIIEGKKINVYKKSKKEVESAPVPAVPATPAVEKTAEVPVAPEPEKKAEEAVPEKPAEEKQAS
ncbi:MAG: 30S ribosomal protein S16 [Candidatus Nealsonbacteria bacterium]|nr:30S ribosomal protein S16 [Candidatus Nealsonbacteria bacterium]